MKAGYVALVGLPNSGKSSLFNAMVEEKISIVSQKPQTTRRRILGLLNRGADQAVMVDSPGIVKAQKGLNAFLAKEAEEVLSEADLALVVLSIDEKDPNQIEEMLQIAKAAKCPCLFLINKVDLEAFVHRILRIEDMIKKEFPDPVVFKLSSSRFKWSNQEGQELQEKIFKALPESQGVYFDTEILTPHTVRDLVAEMIREKCFEYLHQEVPYQMAVKIEKFSEEDDQITHINANLWVGRDSHKGMVIGAGGKVLKEIGQKSRLEIEKFLGKKVYLALNVVTREDWYLNKEKMKELGYVHADD